MRNNKLDLLNPLVGSWITKGQTASGENMIGTDIYDWIDGEFFMLHNVNVVVAGNKVTATEIIHYDDLDDVFRIQSFSNDGLITISTLKIIDDILLIFADRERFQGCIKQNCIKGLWEKLINDEWQPWMNMELTK